MSAAVIPLPRGLSLRPVTMNLAETLGPAVAAMEPWSALDYSAELMTQFLIAEDPALSRLALFSGDALAGVIAVRSPWLRGPYLQLLAVLPPFQGQGAGTVLLNWFEERASPTSRWLWLCYSSFNTRAGAFYARHGFEEVVSLPDLIDDGRDEVLMRKRLKRG
jgi:GNAT superfamily N-acetyltransferase